MSLSIDLPASIDLPDAVQCVLVDVGNVLVDDFWERMLLTPELGLADGFGIDRALATDVGRALWQRFVTDADAVEEQWWEALEDELDITVARDRRSRYSSLVRVNDDAVRWLRELRSDGLQVGIVTDNTAFWFPMQAEWAGVRELVERDLVFASFSRGAVKRATPGLYDIAAAGVDPATTLVVDDREHNLSFARALGFAVAYYAFDPAGRVSGDE